MIVKSFVLRKDKLETVAALCDKDTIAVVRPEKAVETLFKEAARITLVDKKPATEQFEAIRAYFSALSADPGYQKTVDTVLTGVESYLREGMYVQTLSHAIQDYVMVRCARLAAEAVHAKVGGKFLHGTELMVCQTPQHFDWAASKAEMTVRLSGLEGPVVIPGGYGRLMDGYVVRVGKDGAHLMASLIASALNAPCVEFYIEGKMAPGIDAMTYDEATHYCAGSHRPFASSAIWPAKNANIPLLVKDIEDPVYEGTIISTGSAHRQGVVADKELNLLTVYGTGLLGKVGMSSSIFSSLAGAGVNVRFIAQTSSEYSISFAVQTKDSVAAQEALKHLFEGNPLLPLDDVVVLNQEVGIVTVFGSRMRNVPGVSAAVYDKIAAAGISIIASAQGGEELSISLVVAEKDVDKVVELLI